MHQMVEVIVAQQLQFLHCGGRQQRHGAHAIRRQVVELQRHGTAQAEADEVGRRHFQVFQELQHITGVGPGRVVRQASLGETEARQVRNDDPVARRQQRRQPGDLAAAAGAAVQQHHRRPMGVTSAGSAKHHADLALQTAVAVHGSHRKFVECLGKGRRCRAAQPDPVGDAQKDQVGQQQQPQPAPRGGRTAQSGVSLGQPCRHELTTRPRLPCPSAVRWKAPPRSRGRARNPACAGWNR